jgi:hypothetical protein
MIFFKASECTSKMKIILVLLTFFITDIRALTYEIYNEKGEVQTPENYGCFANYYCSDAQGTVHRGGPKKLDRVLRYSI